MTSSKGCGKVVLTSRIGKDDGVNCGECKHYIECENYGDKKKLDDCDKFCEVLLCEECGEICECGHTRNEHKNDLHGRRGKNTSCGYAESYEETNYGTLRPINKCKCKKFKLKKVRITEGEK